MGFEVNGFKVDGFKVDGFKVDGFKVGVLVDGFKVNGFKVGVLVDGVKVDGFRVDGFKVNGFKVNGFKVDGFRDDGFKVDGFIDVGIEEGCFFVGATVGTALHAPGRVVSLAIMHCSAELQHLFTSDVMIPLPYRIVWGQLPVTALYAGAAPAR